MHDNTRAAIAKGRRAWVAKMQAAKTRGEITRFPGGRRARDLPKLAKDRTIRKAQRIVEKARVVAEQNVVKGPWSDLTHPQKLDIETGKALDITAMILNRGAEVLERDGIEGIDAKLLSQVKETALAIISTQMRADIARMQATVLETNNLNDPERRERARQMILDAFKEREPVIQSGGKMMDED